MSKKLSDMSSDERVAHWVHRHTAFVAGDPGGKQAHGSALRLIRKLEDEMWKRFYEGMNERKVISGLNDEGLLRREQTRL